MGGDAELGAVAGDAGGEVLADEEADVGEGADDDEAAEGEEEDEEGRRPETAAETTSQLSSARLSKGPLDSVREWIREEDWEALNRAWNDAEARATAWADGALDDLDPKLLKSAVPEDGEEDDDDEEDDESAGSEMSELSLPDPKASRKPWDETFATLGSDKGYARPLRRYFDALPSETAPPRMVLRKQLDPLVSPPKPSSTTSPGGSQARPPWNEYWFSSPSTDNDGLHPHLRHYFDRRGFETSYRQRPHVDSPWQQSMPPRTPGRPGARELLLRFSASAPSLSSAGAAVAAGAPPGSSSSAVSGSAAASGAASRSASASGSAAVRLAAPPAPAPPAPPAPASSAASGLIADDGPADALHHAAAVAMFGSMGHPLDVRARGQGSITWQTRCRLFGSKPGTKTGQKIPWVTDHHLGSAFNMDSMAGSTSRKSGRRDGKKPSKVRSGGGSQLPSVSPSASPSAAGSMPASERRRRM